MSQNSQERDSRTVYLRGIDFKGVSVDFQKAQKILQSSFKAKAVEDVENIQIKDRRLPDGTITFYAYVTFNNTQSAKKALSLGSITIEEKQIKVQKKPIEKDFQLYIKNIGTLDEPKLKTFFQKFGKVSQIQLYQDFNGVTTGLIKFENPQDSEQFLKTPEQQIDGVNVKTQKFIPKDERREQGNRQLFLKKIPIVKNKQQIEEQLLKQFQQFGVINKRIQVDIKDGSKTGTGIILYENSKSLDIARENFNVNLFGEKFPMQLDYYLSKKDREQAGIIYVNNIKPEADIKELIKLFSTFGKVQTSSFNRSQNRGDNIQRGTITFITKQIMIQALAEWGRLPGIYSYFIDNKPQINIYQDRSERNEFMRTQRPIKQNFPPYQNEFQNMIRPTFGMPIPPMGIPSMQQMSMMGNLRPVSNPMNPMNPMSNPMNLVNQKSK